MPPGVDRRGKPDEEVFAYRVTKERKVFLSWRGRRVAVLSGAKADRFIAEIKIADGKEAQLIMAKATGHFKRGNE